MVNLNLILINFKIQYSIPYNSIDLEELILSTKKQYANNAITLVMILFDFYF